MWVTDACSVACDPVSKGSRVLVTGCAGFLGSHLCEELLVRGSEVVGVDSFSDYYPRPLKEANIAALREQAKFRFVECDLVEARLEPLLEGVEEVFHLAAQPGVRPSFGGGFRTYLRDNVHATQRLLEAAGDADLAAFVYASSSSVYGEQDSYPANEDAPLRPLSPYGSTKVITEQLASSFWRCAGVPVVGLRYFTVYGPRQRPDMAFSRFLANGLAGRALRILGDGRQARAFTYVSDVVAATLAAGERGQRGSVYNVGGGQPVELLEVVELIGQLIGRRPEVEHVEASAGDPRRTDADTTRAEQELGFRAATPLSEGLAAQLAALEEAPRAHTHRLRHRTRRPGVPTQAQPSQGGPRVLAYSHDGFGLGHLRRNLRLLSGLRRQRPDVEALLVTGARSAERLVGGRGFSCVALPPVEKVGNGRYVAEGASSADEVMRSRSLLIAEAVREFDPDLLLVDRYPRGLQDELLPALRERRERRPGAPAVLGLRDILDDAEVIREEWQQRKYSETIVETYATVMCYGDRSVYDPISEYALPPEVARRIRFTGYLADELLAARASGASCGGASAGGRLAVCTLGGGRDAAPIALGFLGAMEMLKGAGWEGVLITGPYMSREDQERLLLHPASRDVAILPMVDDVPSYLAAADVAVCMGGYNTTCELLALAVPAVIVPRVRPRREQLMRAERLGARGLLRWVHPDRMSAAVLAEMVDETAAGPHNEPAHGLSLIDRSGVHTAAAQLAALLPATRPARTPRPSGRPEPVERVGAAR